MYIAQNDIDQKNYKNYDKYQNSNNSNNFDFDYNEKNDDDVEIRIDITMISKITCRQCKLTLKFNNALHKHLKTCLSMINSNSIVLYISAKKSSSTIIKCLNVNVNKNIDIDYNLKIINMRLQK